MGTLREMVGNRQVWTIAVDATVREAARLMTQRQVSSLPVVNKDRLVGIVTERDLVQRLVAAGLDPEETLVGGIMTAALVVVAPSDTREQALARMKSNRVRHLLVVEDGRLIDVLSLRDLLLADVVEKSDEIKQLTSYIYTIPPG